LHHYYAARISAQAVVGSGFAESQQAILLTPEQKNRVQSLLDDFSLTSRAKVLYPELSTGEQRLVLILRALVKQAPLVVLDEPFQCLDRPTRAHLVEWLKHRLLPSQALILVAHHQEDRTLCTDQELHLAAGRMMMG
jgi:molybdate transport system ATP-binding protein